MHERDLMLSEGLLETRGCDAPRSRVCESTLQLGRKVLPGTPVERWASRNRSGITSVGKRIEPPKNYRQSRRAASNTRRDRLIGENIIGHRMSTARRIDGPRFAGLRRIRSRRRAHTLLLYEPSREHGGGGFFQPGIEQLTDFFSEIGGVTESRKFVTLEGVSRGRQEKIPRRFGLRRGHKCLLKTIYLGL
jgi:hypothetical protein